MPDERSLDFQYKRFQKARDADQPALAVLLIKKLLDDYPDFDIGWELLGVELTSLARYDEAEEALTKAIAFSTEKYRRRPLVEMGHLFDEQRDYDRAASWYREAIESAPHHASAYIYLGGSLVNQGRLREAEEIHRIATACDEGCIDEAYFNLGLVLRAQERFAEAARCFREAIRLDPDYRLAKKALRDVEQCLKFAAIEGHS